MGLMRVDIETYSSISLADSGVYAYTESEDFSILLIGYKLDSNPVHVLDLTDPELFENDEDALSHLVEFQSALENPEIIKTAFNANFERTGLAAYYNRPMPPEQWRCTMVHAATLGLPGSLENVGNALGLPEDEKKLRIGKSLITYFCKPCKPTKANGGRTRNFPKDDPEKWNLFKEYNRMDVVSEDAIARKLEKFPVPALEQKLWSLDQKINDDGVLLDMDLANKIVEYDTQHTEKLLKEAQTITRMTNPNSLSQLKYWFKNCCGMDVQKITKDSIEETKEEIRASDARTERAKRDAIRVLEIRQASGKTSTKKYQAMQQAVSSDGRLRGLLKFYGANTGRWSGRIVQPQNLPQNHIEDLDLARKMVKDEDFDTLEMLYGEPADVFSQLIRTAFIPARGNVFVVSDFSAIEARVLSWLAGEEWRLQVFRENGDIYCASASQMFHVPVVKHGINGELRAKGKVAELALGYGGAVGAIKTMDKAGAIPDEEIPGIVQSWRRASPSIPKFWTKIENAVRTSIEEHRTVRMQHGIQTRYVDGILLIKLPSGREIAYQGARIGADGIEYNGLTRETRQWGAISTWGGKLTENVTQAVARDCLAAAMMAVSDELRLPIRFHVHDEMIVEVPCNRLAELEPNITSVMSRDLSWAPGLPLRGDTYHCDFYRKD